jgi:DNA-binding NarL/FixJ family response regulator
MSDSIKIYIIDDHPSVSEALHYAIKPHLDFMKIIGSSANVMEALHNTKIEEANIIILDLYIPDAQPIENVRLIKRKLPKAKLIIFTRELSPMWVSVMQKEGAHAYLTKDMNCLELKRTIRRIMEGELVFPNYPDNDTLPSNQMDDPIAQMNLAPVEQEMVRMYINGISLKQIAVNCNAKKDQINYTFKKIRKKLKVNSNHEIYGRITRK